MASGEQIARIELTEEPLHSVAVAPDGRSVAAGSGTLFLVDLAAPDKRKEVSLSDATIESVCFTDDRTLAAGTRYNGVFLLSADGKLIQRIECHSRARSLQYLPQHRNFLVPNRTTEVPPSHLLQLWNEHLTEVIQQYNTGEATYKAAFSIAKSSPCETYVAATGEFTPWIYIFQQTGELLTQARLSRDQSRDLDYAPDGNSIAAGYRNGHVEQFRVFRQTDGSIAIDDRPLVIRAHSGEVRCVRFIDPSTLATCGEDGRVVLWDLQSSRKELLLALDSSPSIGFELSPDGTELLVSNHNDLLIADVATQEILFRKKLVDGAYVPVWAPNGQQFALRLGFDNSVTIFDKTGAEVRSIAHEARPEDLAYSPSGDILATVGDQFLQLFASHDGSLMYKMRLPGLRNVVAFSHDGRFLASSGPDGRVQVVELKSRAITLEFDCQSGTTALQFSPDDLALTTGHDNSSIQLWDLKTGRLKRTFIGHESPINDLEFSPNGTTLLSSSTDQAIRLWSVQYGRSYGVLYHGPLDLPHGGNARVSLSKDGRRLAVCIRRQDATPLVLVQNLSAMTDE